ncbi:50S ribosomal protein L25 [bacterium]|nr:50S ribosomal protein L25 [bacterium]
MKILTLKAEQREEIGKKGLKSIRNSGFVPGIVYGSSSEPLYLKFNEHDLRVFLQKTRERGIIELQVGDVQSKLTVLAEVQYHPVSERILHIDFKEVPRDKPVETKVPIEYSGESVGVHSGGLFMPRLYELDIKTLPDNVPDSIHVDITDLDFEHAIHVKDLVMPEGIEIVNDNSQTVATVIKPRGLEVEEVEGEEAEEGAETEEEAETSEE